MNAADSAGLLSPFYSTQAPRPWNGATHFRVDLMISVSPLWKHLTDTPRESIISVLSDSQCSKGANGNELSFLISSDKQKCLQTNPMSTHGGYPQFWAAAVCDNRVVRPHQQFP